MRERLVAAFVAFTVGVLALIGIPRAYQLADLVQTQEQRKVDRSADLAAVLVREKAADGEPVTPALLDEMLHLDEHLVYVAADGSRTSSTLGHEETHDDLVARRVLPDGGTVTLTRSGDLVQDRVAQALLPLVLIVLFLVVVAAAAGWAIARAMARPFQRLAAAAQQLGTGRLDLDLPPFRIPEAEKIGAALRTSARQIDGLLAHERELAVHASHELRTPITALRLELEDLALWPQTAPEVAQELGRALAELDRLSDAVSSLLDRSQEQREEATHEVDLAAVIADAVHRCAARHADAQVLFEPTGPVPARIDRAAVDQVLDLLLDGACGAAGVRVTIVVVDAGTHLEVRVGSGRAAGQGQPAERDGERPRQLSAARELARAVGGQVMSVPTPSGQAVVLRLPRGGRVGNG